MTPAPASTNNEAPEGRRERKKAATRTAIADAALNLFLKRGFDAVSIRDIAERADVAVATIFAHFSGKEALVFDEGDAVERSLIAAIDDAGSPQAALAALETWFLETQADDRARAADPAFGPFLDLVHSTPALLEYWKRLWRRHASAASAALESAGVRAPVARLVPILAVETYFLSAAEDDALALLFDTLRSGLPVAAIAGPPASTR